MRASIRKFTLLGVCLGTVFLFAFYIGIHSSLLKKTFTDFEHKSLINNVLRTKNALEEEVRKLDDVIVDWAVWDDSALFMQGKMKNYIASNLNDKTLDTLRLSLIAFIDNNENITWSRNAVDEAVYSATLPEEVRNIIFKQSQMLAGSTSEERIHGIASLEDGLTIIASCPIVDSEGKGPKQGTLIMGRRITADMLKKVSENIRIKFTLEDTGAALPQELLHPRSQTNITQDDEAITVCDIDDNTLAGMILLPDITNRKTLRLIVFGSKDIVHRGIAVTEHSALILAIGGIILLGSIIFLIERRVLRRILGIKSQLNRIKAYDSENNALDHVQVAGTDEIKDLADQMNLFIDEINNYKQNLESLVLKKTSDLHQEILKKQQVQDELEVAKETAERANRTKSDFLAKVTHEIRTPMNAIKGMNDYLLHTPLNAEQIECHKVIRDSSVHLLTIVNDLLDLSKIEAGQLSLEYIDFNLSKLISSTLNILKPIADGKRIGLYVDYTGDPNITVNGDPARIRQILFNLAHNAIKFTQVGEVRVVVAIAYDEQTQTYGIECTVKDTGVGIPRESLAKIFEPFVQSDNSTSRRFGGTGLGLAICKQLLELMGTTIQARSIPGVGSEFSFKLLLQKGNECALIEETFANDYIATPMEQLNILVVDDNQINLKVAEKIFSMLGQKPILANSGREALDLLKTNLFDVIFLDVEMPDLHGFEVTRIIRSGKETSLNQHTPIIAMTAYSLDTIKQQCLQSGMNDFITKPIDIDILFTKLQPFGHNSLIICTEHHAGGTPKEPLAPSRRFDELHILDIGSALTRLGLDRELYADICIGFLEKFNAERFEVLYLKHTPDIKNLTVFIHSLKGLARQIGAERIGFLAEGFERQLRDNDVQGVARNLQALKKEIALVEDALGEYLLR